NGVSQLANTFVSLVSGSYTVTVTDSKGCTVGDSIAISETSPPSIDSIILSPSFCRSPNGNIKVYATGGTGHLSYTVNGMNQLSPGFSNVAAGQYTLTVTDEVGCTITAAVEVGETPMFEIVGFNLHHPRCGSQEGQIAVYIDNYDSALIVLLNGHLHEHSLVFEELLAGTHNITLIDGNGCKEDTVVTLVNRDCPVFIPNIFSPNEDGVN